MDLPHSALAQEAPEAIPSEGSLRSVLRLKTHRLRLPLAAVAGMPPACRGRSEQVA